MKAIAGLMAALTTTGCLLAVGGPAGAAPAARPAGPAAVMAGPTAGRGFFFENYRGHHILGWGRDGSACSYIDGVQLVLYPAGNDRYASALQAYQQERGVRAITRASVRVLGDFDMVPPADPVPHCPAFVSGF